MTQSVPDPPALKAEATPQAEDDPDPSSTSSSPSGAGASSSDWLALACEHGAASAHAEWLGRQIRAAGDEIGPEIESLSVVLVGDEKMSALHDQYLQDPSTTDVLTFDLREDTGQPIEGELVICVDEAERQAGELGHGVEKELLLYAVHGLLHLADYDDHDPDEAQRMHAEEDRILTAIGVGAVYDRDHHA
ncbi:rRNA maturation RNase YbeY [Mucisphaera sp.]|uniref:rRNA maturation RNase YbeY n=1 Tax=Mucisphaera sp. TaxID=2913024 RepID=UPI003D11F900